MRAATFMLTFLFLFTLPTAAFRMLDSVELVELEEVKEHRAHRAEAGAAKQDVIHMSAVKAAEARLGDGAKTVKELRGYKATAASKHVVGSLRGHPKDGDDWD